MSRKADRHQVDSDEGSLDLPLRRPPKLRPEKGAEDNFERVTAESKGNKTTRPTPSDGSAEDRRTRLSRSTKEDVYKNPPWGANKQKTAASDQPANPAGAASAGFKKKHAPKPNRTTGTGQTPAEKVGSATVKRKRGRADSGSTTSGAAEGDERQGQQDASHKVKKRMKRSAGRPASEVSQQAQAATVPARRPYAAAKIDENASSSDDSNEVDQRPTTMTLPPRLARKRHLRVMSPVVDESLLNNDGEDLQGEQSAEESGEEVEERDKPDGARIDIAAEAVVFYNTSTADLSGTAEEDEDKSAHDDSLIERGPRRPANAAHAGSLSSDRDDIFGPAQEEGIEDDPEDRKSSRSLSGKKSARERKLEQEMPVLSGPKKMKVNARSSSNKITDDGEDRPWFAHTDITAALVPTSKTSWTISLTLLNASMAQVVREALRLGAIALQIGDPDLTLATMDNFLRYTPFQPKGLNHYDQLGFGSKNDIAHRLEAGSTALYIQPLAHYVGGRLRTYRGSIKTAAIQVVPGALRLPDGPDQTRDRTPNELKLLATDVNFLFPMSSRTGQFDTSKPFSGPGIKEIIKAAFFVDKQWYNVGFSNLGIFRHTKGFPANEPEVSPVMLALAATALEAALREMTNAGDQDFAGNLFHESFKDHLGTALDFRVRGPANYHSLTHELLVYASNGSVCQTTSAGTGGNGRPRRAKINWDAIQEPTDT